MYKNINTAPLSIKLALVTAAVGAGFAAPAQASLISVGPGDFTPFTVTRGATIDLDIDGNRSTDYIIDFSTYPLSISGAVTGNVIESPRYDIVPATYADPSQFLSTSSMKSNNVVYVSSLTSAAPYIDVVFADQNNVATEGFIKATTTADANGLSSFTLLDFGLVPDSAAVPEPGSLALLAAGAAGIGALRRRRRTARAV